MVRHVTYSGRFEELVAEPWNRTIRPKLENGKALLHAMNTAPGNNKAMFTRNG
jgi:hypothetical protein